MIERFAPSPTGLLHLGHAFSALTAWDAAQAGSGEFLLRIEDIDGSRCREEFEQAIFKDLNWLGLDWPKPVMHQSQRQVAYQEALSKLAGLGLTYQCTCSRNDIFQALAAPQENSDFGPDGPVYPGICRGQRVTDNGKPSAVRIDIGKAIEYLGGAGAVSQLSYQEIGGTLPIEKSLNAGILLRECGDVVLARKDIRTSYHLAVVVDDAAQEISHVSRGIDMAHATLIHRLLQALLDLPTPIYRHHRLIRDDTGKRLAKRHDSMSLQKYRAEGATPSDIRTIVGCKN